MNRKVIALAILLASGSAISSPGDDGCVGNCGGNDNGNTGSNPVTVNSSPVSRATVNSSPRANALSVAKSNARSNSKSTALGVGMGGNATGGSASSSAGGGNASLTSLTGQAQSSDQANSQSTTTNYNEAKQDYSDTYEDYTPSANAYAAPPTATCIVTGGGAFGIPGLSASASGGVIDEVCRRLEMIRSARQDPSAEVKKLGSNMMQMMLVNELKDMQEEEAKRLDAKASRNANFDVLNYEGGG